MLNQLSDNAVRQLNCAIKRSPDITANLLNDMKFYTAKQTQVLNQCVNPQICKMFVCV